MRRNQMSADEAEEIQIRRMVAAYRKRHEARSAAWHAAHPGHAAEMAATRAALRGPRPVSAEAAALAHAVRCGEWRTEEPEAFAAAARFAAAKHARRLRVWQHADPKRIAARKMEARELAWRRRAIAALAARSAP